MTPELKTYKQAGATFLIPCNVVGEAISQESVEYEARQEEAEAAYNWIMQNAEMQLMKHTE